MATKMVLNDGAAFAIVTAKIVWIGNFLIRFITSSFTALIFLARLLYYVFRNYSVCWASLCARTPKISLERCAQPFIACNEKWIFYVGAVDRRVVDAWCVFYTTCVHSRARLDLINKMMAIKEPPPPPPHVCVCVCVRMCLFMQQKKQ